MEYQSSAWPYDICQRWSLIRMVIRKSHKMKYFINSSPPSTACMCRWTSSAFFRQWLGACSAPSHYLNQCWLIVNWTLRNKRRWNSNLNTKLFIQKMHLKMSSARTAVICWTLFPYQMGYLNLKENVIPNIWVYNNSVTITIVTYMTAKLCRESDLNFYQLVSKAN